MGLDITYYRNIRHLPDHPLRSCGDECYDLGHRLTYCYAGMEASMRGLEKVGDPGPGVEFTGGAWYEVETVGGFRAGSYSGYSAFREMLASAVMGKTATDYWRDADAADWPFYELINFADNEGTIGPDAARDLYDDFVQHLSLFEARYAGEDGAYAVEKYHEWTEACRVAGHENGFIDFH